MTLRNTQKQNPTDPGEPSAESRRQYCRPRILYREPIEAMASDCAIPGGKSDSSCILGFS